MRALLNPFILGEKLACRIMGENVSWAKMHYQEPCLKMAHLTLNVKEQEEAVEQLQNEWNETRSHMVN